SMDAVKEDAVSLRLLSVKLAISVVPAIATSSFADVRSSWPFVSIAWLPLCSLLNADESSQTASFRRLSVAPRNGSLAVDPAASMHGRSEFRETYAHAQAGQDFFRDDPQPVTSLTFRSALAAQAPYLWPPHTDSGSARRQPTAVPDDRCRL